MYKTSVFLKCLKVDICEFYILSDIQWNISSNNIIFLRLIIKFKISKTILTIFFNSCFIINSKYI